eukprot:scaffold82803_cov29-Prasinocladus_malaysianus.AAC.1
MKAPKHFGGFGFVSNPLELGYVRTQTLSLTSIVPTHRHAAWRAGHGGRPGAAGEAAGGPAEGAGGSLRPRGGRAGPQRAGLAGPRQGALQAGHSRGRGHPRDGPTAQGDT